MPTPDSTTVLHAAAAGRMRRLLNDGMLAFLTGVGDHAGLLQVLTDGPATAEVVARASALPADAVRWWLAAMVAGQLVDYDGARGTFGLPPETAAFLAGGEGRALRARLGQLCVLVAGDGGGAPPDSAAGDEVSLDDLGQLAPHLTARLRAGARVLELGCGTGALTCTLAAAHPKARCVGRDPRRACIGAARRRAREQRVTNAAFVCGATLPRHGGASYDVVVSADERMLAAPAVVARLGRVMAPGATALLAVPATTGSPGDDALHPFGAYLLGARALSPTRVAPSSTELGARLAAAGFRVRALARLPHDPFRNFLLIEK